MAFVAPGASRNIIFKFINPQRFDSTERTYRRPVETATAEDALAAETAV
jgi:hypothetical protein